MANTILMKKQYQDLFAANEQEKQKCTRTTRRTIPQRGITCQEAKNLTRQSTSLLNSSVEQLTTQSEELIQMSSRSCSEASQRCSNCNMPEHKRTKCPQSSVA